MKKIIIILFCLTVGYSLLNSENQILIPEEAIRFRVIANSDSTLDQSLKMEVKSSVEKEINRLMTQAKNIEEARILLQEALPNIESIVKNHNIDYKINYGLNQFPEKEYKGITYEEGIYESLVITLGNGLGQNWWCVMFPPLCLLEAKDTDLEEVEYKFYVKELLNKYLS